MIRLKQNCSDTCDCQTTVIARYTTNRDNPIWDLTPYKGAGVGKPNTYWRLWERSGELEYNRGEIDANGTLVGFRANLFRNTITTDLWSFNKVVPILVALPILVGTKSLGRLKKG